MNGNVALDIILMLPKCCATVCIIFLLLLVFSCYLCLLFSHARSRILLIHSYLACVCVFFSWHFSQWIALFFIPSPLSYIKPNSSKFKYYFMWNYVYFFTLLPSFTACRCGKYHDAVCDRHSHQFILRVIPFAWNWCLIQIIFHLGHVFFSLSRLCSHSYFELLRFGKHILRVLKAIFGFHHFTSPFDEFTALSCGC